jgi:hypothetical protein
MHVITINTVLNFFYHHNIHLIYILSDFFLHYSKNLQKCLNTSDIILCTKSEKKCMYRD